MKFQTFHKKLTKYNQTIITFEVYSNIFQWKTTMKSKGALRTYVKSFKENN